jgi:hypothetical protein
MYISSEFAKPFLEARKIEVRHSLPDAVVQGAPEYAERLVAWGIARVARARLEGTADKRALLAADDACARARESHDEYVEQVGKQGPMIASVIIDLGRTMMYQYRVDHRDQFEVKRDTSPSPR